MVELSETVVRKMAEEHGFKLRRGEGWHSQQRKNNGITDTASSEIFLKYGIEWTHLTEDKTVACVQGGADECTDEIY